MPSIAWPPYRTRTKPSLINNIPVAYAVTYLIGTAFIVWFLPNVGPKLMRVNLKEEARKLRAKIAASGGGEPETLSAYQALAVRAYQGHEPGFDQSKRGRT